MLAKRNNYMLPSIMNDFLSPDWFGGIDQAVQHKAPAVNIIETDEGFNIEMSIPGFNKEDFKIEIDNEVLSISSEVGKEDVSNEKNYSRREFTIASFKRSFSLPDSADSDKVDANYNNGILLVNIPKKEEAKPKAKRTILIG